MGLFCKKCQYKLWYSRLGDKSYSVYPCSECFGSRKDKCQAGIFLGSFLMPMIGIVLGVIYLATDRPRAVLQALFTGFGMMLMWWLLMSFLVFWKFDFSKGVVLDLRCTICKE